MLAIDASATVDLCLSPGGFADLVGEDLLAPPLILSESLSALHEMRWREKTKTLTEGGPVDEGRSPRTTLIGPATHCHDRLARVRHPAD